MNMVRKAWRPSWNAMIGGTVLLAPALLWAATPSSGTVSEGMAVTWTGPFKTPTNSAECNGPNDPACDNFVLTIVPPPPEFGPYAVEVTLQPFGAGDWDVQVYNPDNAVVASSGEAPGVLETATVINPPAGVYTVAGAAFAPIVGPDADGDSSLDSYTARAEIKPWTPVLPPGSEYITYKTFPDPEARPAAEPSIGANWVSGNTMYIASRRTLRVTWDDCSSPPAAEWLDVSSATTTGPSLDPILFTDSVTGRTFVSQLSANCSTAAFTDDDGASWIPSQGCGVNSGVDHQSIGSGPYHAPIPTPPPPLFPHAVYYCAQSIADATCSRSDNGGLTFGPAVPMYNLTQCGGLHGEPAVAPDGTVYLPNRSCTGRQGVIVSEDNGLTWTVRRIPFTTPGDWDPDIGIGSDGTVYVGMGDGDGHPKIAVSTDKGVTWSVPVDVGIPFDIDNTSFSVVVAGDGDRAAFGFLGIDADQPGAGGDDPSWPGGDPTTRPFWHMYVAHTYDRGATWTTIDVTGSDPVQRGTIFSGGFTVDGAVTRNLLDFNRITVDKFGRVLIGFADGCVGNCVTGGANSGTAAATISRQVGGKRLFAQYDSLDVPAAPDLSAKTSAGPPAANIISWDEPDDRGSRITGYTVYRRTPTTEREMIAGLGPDARNHTDSDVVAGQTYFYSLTATNSLGESSFCREVTPGDAPPPVHPCDYPGVAVLSDAPGDPSTTLPAHDALSLSVTEPLSLGSGKIMFVLKMAGLETLTPDTYWPVQFNVGATPYVVRMSTFPPATPQAPIFEYYEGTWNSLLPTVSPADPASNFHPDGTIQFVVPRSGVGDPAVGSSLTSFLVRIAINAGGVLLTPDNMPDSGAGAGSYQVYGSENCVDDGSCPNPIFSGLQTVTSPTEATCTLDLSWNTATTACPPPSYNIYRSTDSGFTPSGENLIAIGVEALSYRDQAGLEFGTTYYYIVRAEDKQTSFDGPANRGKEEDNLIRVSGSPSGAPAPAPDFVDDFEPAAEPGWAVDTAANANPSSPEWTVTADPFAHSASNSFFSAAGLDLKDDRLVAPPQYLSSSSRLTFWHRFSFEPGYDGGVVEVSTDGGSTWVDVIAGGGVFIQGGYNDVIAPDFGSPIAGRNAWTGDSESPNEMNQVEIELGAFTGPGVILRWRLALDPLGAGATPGLGWWIDDVTVSGLVEAGPCSTPACGDGVVNAGEQCDDGAFNSDTQPDACRTNCTAARCGDAVKDSDEGCDEGLENSDSQADACRTNCQPAHCGDEVLDSGELCDDGPANSDTAADACRSNCLPARCGDGVIDSGEACDDGLANSDVTPDACRTVCQQARCGDGVTDTGESCDDGNPSSGDGCSAACQFEVTDPQADPSGIDKCRFISFSIPAPEAGTAETAIRVRLVSLHHVDPPYTGGASIPFTAFEGQDRWAGPPAEYLESSSTASPFYASALQCTPHYQDWSTVGLLHVTGSVVVPSSIYEVQSLASSCAGAESSCTAVSASLEIRTTRWGDIEIPYNPPATSTQPDVGDISALVNKFRSASGAPIKARALLTGSDEFGNINIAPDTSFSHIAACVDAFRGGAYPFEVQSCP